MGRFVTGGGEKKRNVPDKAERECFGREVWHKEFRLESQAAECKEGGAKKRGWMCGRWRGSFKRSCMASEARAMHGQKFAVW
jgi:hypothetical protein